MELVTRHRPTLAIVLVALAAGGGLLVFGRSSADQRTVDLAHVRHYGAALVRRTFAEHGIRLRYSSAPGVDPMYLSWTPLPAGDNTLYVSLVRHGSHISWGPKPAHEYDQPVGNLLVHYGGHDPATLARVEAAVAALSR
ncbi:MAG TPA: hypothetical protein VLW49_09205 [Gaiellaceae bacterium]|nr:hypothetical protein [Gaiellaceae bacterium]